MPDVFSRRKRSEVMSRIRSKDTKAEILVRSALHRRGFRFRLHVADLPGRPDIVLPKYGVAIQVRGCFWHGHTCIDGHIPKSRRAYWTPKLEGNRERDKRNDRRLRAMGWKVLVVWACKCERPHTLDQEVSRIERALTRSQV